MAERGAPPLVNRGVGYVVLLPLFLLENDPINLLSDALSLTLLPTFLF